jgi:indole-3-glycerol phosphate synthase
VLRKDFIVSRYQIFESAMMGADAVLLIVRAISSDLLRECLDLCRRIGLDALVEVHSAKEFDAASEAGATLIGINNRDLSTFTTDIRTSMELVRRLQPGQVAVSESGIRGRDQIDRLLDSGIWNFLIGESLVTAPQPEAVLARLLGSDAA